VLSISALLGDGTISDIVRPDRARRHELPGGLIHEYKVAAQRTEVPSGIVSPGIASGVAIKSTLSCASTVSLTPSCAARCG
jgi:hypothetical protein